MRQPRSYYDLPDTGEAFDKAYDRSGRLRRDMARGRAGNALLTQGYDAAAGELLQAGDVEAGARLKYYGQQGDYLKSKSDAEQTKRKEEAAADFGEKASARLAAIYRESKGNIAATLAAFDQLGPEWQQHDETPEELAQVREMLAKDPENTLLLLGAEARKVKQAFMNKTGIFTVYEDGDVEQAQKFAPEPIEVSAGASLYDPATGKQLYTAPKQFAPPRPSAVSGSGAAGPSSGRRPPTDRF